MQRNNLRLTTLADSSELTESRRGLIERNFPRGSSLSAQISLEDEFALLLDPSNAARSVVLVSENQAIAHAAYRVFDVQLPGQKTPLRCAGIGLVVTDEAHRGQGHAKRIQLEIERRAREEGCVLAVLWSDLTDFYSRLDYVVVGSELQWHLEGEELRILRQRLQAEREPAAQKLSVEAITSLAPTRTLYNQLATGPERSSSIYDRFLTFPDTYGFLAAAGAQPAGYAFMGKARDLRDTVHELVGKPESVAPLLAACAERAQKALRVHQPLRSPLQAELEHWLGPAERCALAFFKVLDVKALARWLESSGTLPTGTRILVGAKGQIEIAAPSGIFFETDDAAHLLQLFLGPWEPRELEDLPPLIVEKLTGTRLPALYFWGFDSV
ncbi:MAG: GNAT family N-acetyltransferase [Bdellovibrionales bacterium]|nr:GNAT family N-acetyltransferase [Bdellovibrionales bacterium]